MPFGLIFGAVFFGLLCSWLGFELLGEPGAPARSGGALLIATGVSLALGLLQRRPWARWIGLLCAVGLLLFGGRMATERGDALDFVVLFAATGTGILLLLPATAVGKSVERYRDAGTSYSDRTLSGAAAVCALGLAGVAIWGYATDEPRPDIASVASRPILRVHWTDFGAGLGESRAGGKPLLVNFITDWCGYCKKMDRTTWKHPSVVERLDELVAVRVDTEDSRAVNGFSGADIAARYGINGTPTTMLLGGDGAVLARAGGYQDPRQFLTWLEESLNRVATNQLHSPVNGR